MKKTSFWAILWVIGVLASVTPAFAQVPAPVYDPRPFGSTLELHVADSGKVTLAGARIEQIAGSTFYARMYWGTTFLRMSLRTDAKTKFTKRFGQTISVSDISVGDFVSVEGTFLSGSSSFDISVTTLKDWSLQTEDDTYSGTITSVNTPADGFYTLTPKNKKPLTLQLATSTVITRGSLTVGAADLTVGKKILLAAGVYDHISNTLVVHRIKIYQDMSIFQPRNFEGEILSITGSAVPATMVVKVGVREYTVGISETTQILNVKRQVIALPRFIAGDKVRIYGAIPESNTSFIRAEIVRNLNL